MEDNYPARLAIQSALVAHRLKIWKGKIFAQLYDQNKLDGIEGLHDYPGFDSFKYIAKSVELFAPELWEQVKDKSYGEMIDAATKFVQQPATEKEKE